MVRKSASLATFNPPEATITPYQGTFGRTQLLHLLRRTLFGVSNADMKAFEGKTLDQVVDALLNVSDFTPAPPVNDYSFTIGSYKKDANGNILKDANGKPIIDVPAMGIADDQGVKFGETWINVTSGTVDGQRRSSFKSWWLGLMLLQERNLREKMTLFFANHFSMEADTVNTAYIVYRSNVLTRKHCLGNFKTLIKEMTIDAGMLIYLNGNRNNKTAPDENYARELQELFTVGKGADASYTEDDVKAAAKVLTGWTVNRTDFTNTVTFRATLHDTTDKQFSAFYKNRVIKGDKTTNGGANEIAELVDMIFETEAAAKFLIRKLYTFFVFHNITDDIEKNVIAPLATIFRDNNFEIKPVLKALFTSDEFFKPDHIGAMIKSPIDHAVGMFRQFEMTVPTDPALFEVVYKVSKNIQTAVRSLGQDLQDPPNVAGWPAYYQAPFYYDMWLDTATYPIRETYQKTISTVNGIPIGDGISVITEAARGLFVKIDYSKWLKGFSNPKDASALINDIAFLMYGVAISKAVQDKLKNNKLYAKVLNQTITTDAQWSDAVTKYLADPNTTDAVAKTIPNRMQVMITYMMRAAEFHLH